MKKEINIFIISPTDVNDERVISQKVCLELNEVIGHDVKINPVLWEYNPMSYHKDAQENIDIELDKCDIFIVILWHRLGSIVEGYEGAVTKSKNVTGTQYEIEKILATKKEAIFFYFKTQDKSFSSSEVTEASKQKKLLNTFLQEINLTKGSTKHGYHEFKNTDEFRKKLKSHLSIEVERQTKTKINVPYTKGIKNKRIIFLYIFILLSVIVLLGDFLLNTEKIITNSSQNIAGTSVYLKTQDIINSELNQKIYHHFLEVLTKGDIKVLSNEKNSDFSVIVEFNANDTKYIISEMNMMKADCKLSYIVVDLTTGDIIKSKSISGESINFNSIDANKECLESIYLDLSQSMIPILFDR